MSPGLAQSVQVRLVRHAKALDVDPNLILARYATERLLYRLSRSSHAERFVLKGALLLLVWLGETIRPTRQVDVGIGDDVIPDPEWLEYPSLLGFPRPRLRAYRPETAIAEKVHAMVMLGSKNSRMRDFFDVHALAMRRSFEGDVLMRALRATFARRRTEIPAQAPIALTPAFADVEGKRAQWAGFVRRSRLMPAPAALETVIAKISAFIGPVLEAAASGERFTGTWAPGGPWASPIRL
jgi:nucleotidyltransferase AbiEii toxin of type IV toxin-antitoxin system